MDGDARRSDAPHTADYNVHVDYELPNRRRPPVIEHDDEPEDDEPAASKPSTPRWKKRLFAGIGGAVLLAALIGGLLYWLEARHYASTDDAFIDAYISQVSSRVAGRVTNIAFADNEHVKAGQLLLELDPRDDQVKLEQAQAQRAQAAAQVEQARAALLQQQAAVDQAAANVRVSEADLAQARADAARYRGISAQAVSRQSVDNANNTVKSTEARTEANRQAVAAAQANVQAQQATIDAALANLKAADAAVDNATLQLSYNRIVAPRDGQIAKRTVNLGDFVNPGQSLLAVVGEDRWITANFKETQLAGMRPGQIVELSVDACPDDDITGRVDSFQPGSGSVFSSLPAENATGNYVKVVQRIPVKITLLHPQAIRCPLSPGMSAVPSVRVR